MPVVRRRDRASFAVHAAPAAIALKLRQARGRLAEAQEEVRWLEALKARRASEIEADLWPRKEPT